MSSLLVKFGKLNSSTVPFLEETVSWRSIAALVFVLIVPLLRAYAVIVHPQLWAEDGALFLQSAWNNPSAQSLLVPYSGYLHTIPRLTALLAVHFPLIAIPSIFLIASWAVYAIPILYFLFLPGIRDTETRLLLCTVYAFAPIREAYLNLTNLMWYTVPTLVLLIAYPVAKSKLRRLTEDLFIALCSVTGPFSIFLLPVAVLLGKRHRAVERPIILGLGACVQIYFLIHSPRTHASPAAAQTFQSLMTFLQATVWMKIFSPHSLMGRVAFFAAEAVLILIAIYLIHKFKGAHELYPLALGAVVLLQIIAMWRTGSINVSPRYLLLPSLSISVSLASAVTLKSIPTALRRAILIVLLLFLVISNRPVLARIAPPWPSQVSLYYHARKGEKVCLATAPAGWAACLIRK